MVCYCCIISTHVCAAQLLSTTLLTNCSTVHSLFSCDSPFPPELCPPIRGTNYRYQDTQWFAQPSTQQHRVAITMCRQSETTPLQVRSLIADHPGNSFELLLRCRQAADLKTSLSALEARCSCNGSVRCCRVPLRARKIERASDASKPDETKDAAALPARKPALEQTEMKSKKNMKIGALWT